MLEMKYSTPDGIYTYEVKIKDAEELTLSEMFSHFVQLTKCIGYHEGSWENVVKDVLDEKNGINKNYTIWDWAMDTLSPM